MGADEDKLMAETESSGVADAVGRYGASSDPESVEKTHGKYKRTEVGVIPKDWEGQAIPEICWLSGTGQYTKQNYANGMNPY